MGIAGLTLRLLNRGQWTTLEGRPQHSGADDQAERDERDQHGQIAIIGAINSTFSGGAVFGSLMVRIYFFGS